MNALRTALAVAPLLAVAVAADKPYFEGYGDVVYTRLTGFSTFQQLRYGIRKHEHDFHFLLRNEYYDTNGTDLPFRYTMRGTGVGAGYRYWFPGNRMFFTAQYTRIVLGENRNQDDFRAGLAGYTDWRNGSRLTDLYGELFYVDRAEDTFLSVRARPGIVLKEGPQGRLWAYGVGQVWASGKGENGTENRIEAGVGIGYLFAGRVTFNAELRAGHSFRGNISNRNYFNPTFVIAANF